MSESERKNRPRATVVPFPGRTILVCGGAPYGEYNREKRIVRLKIRERQGRVGEGPASDPGPGTPASRGDGKVP